MRSMISLAKTRVDEDKATYEREVDAAKKGYGMMPDASKPSSAPQIVLPAPKTADDLAKQLGIH